MSGQQTRLATTVFVIGTRAQLIKVAPVIVACEDLGLPLLLLLTGQHQETMDDLMEEFGVRTPAERLVPAGERATVMSLARWLPQVYWRLSRQLKALARQGRPSVLVHGDTLSTLLGALAARQVGARVVHLESGLSSGRLFDPFPEELSRRAVFRLAHIALCPDAQTADYMRAHHRCEVVDTGGNTIVDAVRLATARPAPPDDGGGYFVASLHRFQNIFDATRLRYLVDLLLEVSKAHPIHFVLHPATRKRLATAGLLDVLAGSGRVRLSPRLGYSAFLSLAARAQCVLTDGGSNQEELAVLGVPTVVMRQRTERSDGLGANAIMESDLPADAAGFFGAGAYDALRMRAHEIALDGPSSRVAARLERLARG